VVYQAPAEPVFSGPIIYRDVDGLDFHLFLFSRYRLPAVPGLVLVGAAGIEPIFTSWKEYRKNSVLVLVLVVLALAAPLLVNPKPKEDLVFYNLALVYERMGNTPLAVQNYKNAVAANPNDFLSCINLGNLAAKEKRWEEALGWNKKAESIESKAEGVHINLSNAYVTLGLYNEAEKAFDRAFAINPENIEALHNKAILFALRKQYLEALEINERVLQLDTDWPPALRFLERINRLLKE
jgi:tetratricopeptide (TPR) repeat protein